MRRYDSCALNPILASTSDEVKVRSLTALWRRAERDREVCDLLCLDLPKADTARAQVPAAAELEALAASANALGDATRLALDLAPSCGRASFARMR